MGIILIGYLSGKNSEKQPMYPNLMTIYLRIKTWVQFLSKLIKLLWEKQNLILLTAAALNYLTPATVNE